MINKGEESSPSSFVSLSAQVKIPQSCPLNAEAGNISMLKAETDHLSLDILIPAQLASIELERVAYQMTEEEGAQSWNSSLDVDYSKKNKGVDYVSVSPAQENDGASSILVVQTTKETDKYTAAMII